MLSSCLQITKSNVTMTIQQLTNKDTPYYITSNGDVQPVKPEEGIIYHVVTIERLSLFQIQMLIHNYLDVSGYNELPGKDSLEKAELLIKTLEV